MYGEKFYPGLKVPVRCVEEGTWIEKISDRFRIILIQEGSGILEIEDCSMSFIAPALFCINEEEWIVIHSDQVVVKKELVFHPSYLSPSYNFDSIRITPSQFIESGVNEVNWLHGFTMRSETYKGYLTIGITTAKRIENLMHQTQRELEEQRDYYWPCRTRSYLLELLLVIDRSYIDSSNENTLEITLGMEETYKVIMYLNNNYKEKIKIATLTEKFNINRTTLNENFKKVTGVPVMTYLINLRMKMACVLLKDTALQITEITYRVGFNDNSHFVKSFKKHAGLAPSEYRETYTWLYK